MDALTAAVLTPQPLPAPVIPERSKKVTAALSKAVALHLEGKLEEAARLLDQPILAGEQDAALYSALGHIRYELRDYAAAAAAYGQLAELEPGHRTAAFNLAVCQGNLKEWKTAAGYFRTALEIDSARGDALLGLGISLIHDGRPAEAVEAIDKYLGLFPDSEQAIFAKAVILHQTGRAADAVEHYRRLLASNPRCEDALSNLVALFLEKQDAPSARRYAEMLAELKPESPVAAEALATVAFSDGDFLTAARHCLNLTESAASRFEHWFNLGVAYHRIGNYQKAAQAYERAAALQPDSALAYLNLGVVRQESAISPAPGRRTKRLTRSTPRSPAPCGTWRWFWSRRGERDWAEKTLRQNTPGCPGMVRRVFPVGLPLPAARRLRRQRGRLRRLYRQASRMAGSVAEPGHRARPPRRAATGRRGV